MSAKMILPAVLAITLTATGAFAQQMQYDRTGDHMASYGAAQATIAPTPTHVNRRAGRHHEAVRAQVPAQIDRTGDHMLYYGPNAQ